MQTCAPIREVVVIEDDVPFRNLLAVQLRLNSQLTLVGSYGDARSALNALAGSCPDAIVLDVGLPGMSGMEALPMLRAECPQTTIVIYTANPELATDATRLGADAVVSKGEIDGDRLFLMLATHRLE